MSVKSSRSALAYLSAPDAANLTLPDAGWAIGFVVTLDGTTTGNNTQYLVSTNNYQEAGGFGFVYATSDYGSDSTVAGRFAAYINTSGSFNAKTLDVLTPGASYFIVFQHSGGGVHVRHCPILTTAPTDGSAVRRGTTDAGFTGNLDGPRALTLFTRATLEVAKSFDHSASRIFRYDGALTDFEVAQLAFGKELADLGKTPAWYERLNDISDFADRGSLGVPFAKTGTLTNGTAPGFGYVPTTSAPAFTSAPTIDGSPQVGTTVTYTRGSFTGTPVPEVTQQWYIAGVAVSGATGATYIPTTADAAKALGVRQILNNSQGGPIVSDSATKTVAAAANAIAVAAPAADAEKVYPRIGTSASVALSGTYTGTQPSSIEYRLYAVDGTTMRQDWTAASANIVAGGTWTAAPLILVHPEKYRIAVRAKDGSGNVLSTSVTSTNRFGVGLFIATVGSSTVATWYGSGSGGSNVPNTTSTSYVDANGFRNFDANGYISQVASYLAVQFGCVVAMVNVGISGETLTQFATPGSGPYNLMVGNIALAGNRLEGLWLSAGSNDASNNYLVTSVSQHLGKLRAVATTVRTRCNQPDLPVLISGMNGRPGSSGNAAGQDPMSDWVRQAETIFGDADDNVYGVQCIDLPPGGDGVHLTGAGFQAQLQRMQYVWTEAIKNGVYHRGPKITAFSFVGNVVTATIQYRNGTANDFTPLSGAIGFTVTDADPSGVAPTVTAVEHLDATHVKISCSRALVAPVVTKHLSGSAPSISAPIFDNGAVPLPLTMETVLATSASTAFATTVTFPVVDAAGVAVTGLVNLDYAFYDQPRISAGAAPVKCGTSFSVSNGTASISIAGVTALMPGGIGRIEFGDSALVKAAIGQVAVS